MKPSLLAFSLVAVSLNVSAGTQVKDAMSYFKASNPVCARGVISYQDPTYVQCKIASTNGGTFAQASYTKSSSGYEEITATIYADNRATYGLGQVKMLKAALSSAINSWGQDGNAVENLTGMPFGKGYNGDKSKITYNGVKFDIITREKESIYNNYMVTAYRN
ncbi:hypothetical protein MD588_24190 [Photobacterium sp. SDRW27]|uniref:hypothetical protein n=1 Tax=Photobacterium obscurum TaxID=2829490 RepID=UPI002243B7C9|nr:hypothetical protein [Photobacterium obscurum]MCW8331904.1 hypothetical protein [Photobacterium obscurum]